MNLDDSNKMENKGGWADLHIHTLASDGVFSPEKVVELAAAKNLTAVGITDHDSVAGVEPAAVAGKSLDVEVIPGIEISATDASGDVHLLGYFIDIHNPTIKEYVHLLQKERVRRARKIVELLRLLGMKLNIDLILQKAGHGSIGRPHIADALMEEGYVLSYDEAFYKYLGNGKPAFVPKFKVSPVEGIQLIHQAGGLAFLAHPGMDVSQDKIQQYIKWGLDGLEILHPRHDQEKVNELYHLAIQNCLLVSGGSDCHGNRNGKELLGQFTVPYQFVKEMKRKLEMLGLGSNSATL